MAAATTVITPRPTRTAVVASPAPARIVKPAAAPGLVRKSSTVAVAPGGKTYASVDARFNDLFKRQKEEARAAAIFLSGLAAASEQGGDRVLSDAERAAVASYIEQVTTQARRYMKDVNDNKASISSEDATILNDVERQLNLAFSDALAAGRSGFYDSTPITTQRLPAVLAEIKKRLASGLMAYAAVVQKYNKGSTAAWAGKAATGLAGLASSLWDVATAPLRIAKWVLIGLAVVFVTPPILKIIIASRKSTDAGLQAGAEAAEAARSAVVSAGKGAATLASRAGAAVATGGQSEAFRKLIPGMAGLGRAGARRRRRK